MPDHPPPSSPHMGDLRYDDGTVIPSHVHDGVRWVRLDPEGELIRLRRWKAEALPLLELLDRLHDEIPEQHQARLGHSKAEAVQRYLQHLHG